MICIKYEAVSALSKGLSPAAYRQTVRESDQANLAKYVYEVSSQKNFVDR